MKRSSMFEINCDNCPEVEELEAADFDTARTAFRRDGWKAVKVGKEWEHFCPSCAAPGAEFENV